MSESTATIGSTTKEPYDAKSHMRKIKTRQGMREYLDVKWRILWLRHDHDDARIETAPVRIEPEFALFAATVTLANGAVAMGHGSETKGDFADFIEKAEQKAIGRALATLGYGTEAAGDFADDDEPPAPTPIRSATPPPRPVPTPAAPPVAVIEYDDSALTRRHWGDFLGKPGDFSYRDDPTPLAEQTEETLRGLIKRLGFSAFGLVHFLNEVEARAPGVTAGRYTRLAALPETLGRRLVAVLAAAEDEAQSSLAAPETAI